MNYLSLAIKGELETLLPSLMPWFQHRALIKVLNFLEKWQGFCLSHPPLSLDLVLALPRG